MKKIGIIIQARINSTRLHGKVLKYLDDKTLIEWVIKRLKKTQIKNIILATGNSKDNLELQKLLEALSKSLINKKYLVGDSLSIADISIAAQLSLLKFPKSAGPILSGEGSQEYINNPYLENLFIWRNNLEEYLFSANSQ